MKRSEAFWILNEMYELANEAQKQALNIAQRDIEFVDLMPDVPVQRWISVKDRLPPYNHDVLVYRPNMAMKIIVDSYNGYYGEDDNEWYEGWAKYGKDIHNNPLITHWQYLPEPPKEDAE